VNGALSCVNISSNDPNISVEHGRPLIPTILSPSSTLAFAAADRSCRRLRHRAGFAGLKLNDAHPMKM
jgi:hypothetical protein